MKEVFGNIWDYHKQGHWVAVTTNGIVNARGINPMGKGVALQAKLRFPELPKKLGSRIHRNGNHVHVFPEYRIITFPTKHHWSDPSDINLIRQSTHELANLGITPVFLVRPGCNNGMLDWKDVRPIVSILSDDFTVVERNKNGI